MKKILFIVAFMLSGCVSVTPINGKYQPTNANNIKVILDNDDVSTAVPCQNSVQIGFIETPWLWNGSRAISKIRDNAANLGGDWVKVTLAVNGFNDVMGNAVVYKCK